jgi:hypothetical protein
MVCLWSSTWLSSITWKSLRPTEEMPSACGEEVMRLGNRPTAYAEGILDVCKPHAERL